jgi:RecA/RadA recombinase
VSDVKKLKEALVGELLKQFEDGVTIVDKEGEIRTVSVDSKIMGVAAKVIKDFADETRGDEHAKQQAEKLSNFLEKRKGLKLVK